MTTCAGFDIDADGVLEIPHRVSRLRTVTKKEERELRLEWYSGREREIKLKIIRVIVQRKAPVSVRQVSTDTRDREILDQMERELSAAHSGSVKSTTER